MRTVLKASLLPLVVLALTGCGISGTWSLDSIEPKSAAASFEIHKVVLRDDGTYCACFKRDGEPQTAKGEYELADGKLTFKAESREPRVYDAKLAGLCGELHVTGGDPDSKWTAVLKRSQCKCGSGACRCGGGTCKCGSGPCECGATGLCAVCGKCPKGCTCPKK
jgi:hypothetical protein